MLDNYMHLLDADTMPLAVQPLRLDIKVRTFKTANQWGRTTQSGPWQLSIDSSRVILGCPSSVQPLSRHSAAMQKEAV